MQFFAKQLQKIWRKVNPVMKKITEKIKIFVGLLMLLLLFSFNLVHALNDYGVSNPNNKLHPQVYAQTNTAGGGGSTTNPEGGGSTPDNTPPGGCTMGDRDSYYQVISNFQHRVWGGRWADNRTWCENFETSYRTDCRPGGPYNSCSSGSTWMSGVQCFSFD